jgi:hypothetical protein
MEKKQTTKLAWSKPGAPPSIQQIVVEQVQDGFRWDAFGEEDMIAGDFAESLTSCMASLINFLRDEWKLSL